MKIIVSSLVDLKKSQHNRPHQFVKFLSKKHDVTVLSVNDWWKGKQGDLDSYSSDFNDFFQNIEYHYLTNSKVPPFIQEVFFTKKIKELSKENFDVHLNYNSLITGYRVSKEFKTVFDLADDIPAMIRSTPQIPGFLSHIGGRMGDYYIEKNIKIADFFTFTAKELRNNYPVNEQKSAIIPNGVDLEIFKKINNAKEKLGLDGFIIGYVGVLREWVDFEPVLQALKCLDRDIKLMIVGSEGKFNETKSLVDLYGLNDRVIFTGMVNHSKIPLYISAMDICIIPFKLNEISHNALPMKLFEYMACGKPVISSEIMPIKSNFSQDVLFVSNSADYAKTIKVLYEDDLLRRKYGEKGAKISLSYDWDAISSNMEKILHSVANNKSLNIK